MNLRMIIKPLPPTQLLLFLGGASAVVQCVITSYRHLTGVHIIEDAVTLWATIILSSLISTLAGLILAIPDLRLITILNKRLKWGKRTLLRICIQTLSTVLIALIVSTLITLSVEGIIGYEEPIINVLIRNGMIFPVINIILVAILEGWIFFREYNLHKEKADTLSRELGDIRFEVLKKQIDPHFMFNSLNVLSALIDSDPNKAQQFIEEFSDMYRYVLDTIEKPLVSVGREIRFIQSYLYLQRIRHHDSIVFINRIPEEVGEEFIPPFSLHTVLENAIKHNASSPDTPLVIEIEYKDGYLVVSNNIQAPLSARPSTGVGLKNLTKRYELITEKIPGFERTESLFIAKLPLIERY